MQPKLREMKRAGERKKILQEETSEYDCQVGSTCVLYLPGFQNARQARRRPEQRRR